MEKELIEHLLDLFTCEKCKHELSFGSVKKNKDGGVITMHCFNCHITFKIQYSLTKE